MKKFISLLLAACLCITCFLPAALAEQTALPASALSSLTNNCPTTGIMLPAEFNPLVYTYLLTVASWVTRVTFIPVCVDPKATIDVSGSQISSGETSQVFAMTDDPQVVTISVTAANKENSVYSI
ncbi:MAG: cadherin-like beta sandwich domain-containing protein, partial [Eubacteriales bacterium]|nr:cadherin-like beta sandwich domain-containing protein [Eubacteriales bacterium]